MQLVFEKLLVQRVSEVKFELTTIYNLFVFCVVFQEYPTLCVVSPVVEGWEIGMQVKFLVYLYTCEAKSCIHYAPTILGIAYRIALFCVSVRLQPKVCVAHKSKGKRPRAARVPINTCPYVNLDTSIFRPHY